MRMVAILGTHYFNMVHPTVTQDSKASQFDGRHLIASACQQVASWPRPRGGEVMCLPFCGVGMQVELPSHNQLHAQLLESSGFVKLHKITSPMSTSSMTGSFDQLRSLAMRNEQILASMPATLVYPSGYLAS